MPARVSMIVRCKDREETIEGALVSLRAQTVSPEIILVDSGSKDRTLEIARPYCERVIEIAPEEFSYGRALNLGAAAATAPIHGALSSHCALPREDWIERALACYERADVAAATGMTVLPDGRQPLPGETFHQRLEDLQRRPYWGMSNHASTWRAAVWELHRFDEQLEYAEDLDWGLRVLRDGWTIAFQAELHVDLSHRWRQGFVQYYRREKRAARVLGSLIPFPYGVRECLHEWWDDPDDPRPPWRRRLNPLRTGGLVGKLQGHRAAARRRRGATRPGETP